MPYLRDTNLDVFVIKRPMCCSQITQLSSARFATQRHLGHLVTCARDVFGLNPFRVPRNVSLVANRNNYRKVSSRLKFYKYYFDKCKNSHFVLTTFVLSNFNIKSYTSKLRRIAI